MSRLSVSLVAVLVFFAFVAGCGGGGGSAAVSGSGSSVTTAPVKIKFNFDKSLQSPKNLGAVRTTSELESSGVVGVLIWKIEQVESESTETCPYSAPVRALTAAQNAGKRSSPDFGWYSLCDGYKYTFMGGGMSTYSAHELTAFAMPGSGMFLFSFVLYPTGLDTWETVWTGLDSIEVLAGQAKEKSATLKQQSAVSQEQLSQVGLPPTLDVSIATTPSNVGIYPANFLDFIDPVQDPIIPGTLMPQTAGCWHDETQTPQYFSESYWGPQEAGVPGLVAPEYSLTGGNCGYDDFVFSSGSIWAQNIVDLGGGITETVQLWNGSITETVQLSGVMLQDINTAGQNYGVVPQTGHYYAYVPYCFYSEGAPAVDLSAVRAPYFLVSDYTETVTGNLTTWSVDFQLEYHPVFAGDLVHPLPYSGTVPILPDSESSHSMEYVFVSHTAAVFYGPQSDEECGIVGVPGVSQFYDFLFTDNFLLSNFVDLGTTLGSVPDIFTVAYAGRVTPESGHYYAYAPDWIHDMNAVATYGSYSAPVILVTEVTLNTSGVSTISFDLISHPVADGVFDLPAPQASPYTNRVDFELYRNSLTSGAPTSAYMMFYTLEPMDQVKLETPSATYTDTSISMGGITQTAGFQFADYALEMTPGLYTIEIQYVNGSIEVLNRTLTAAHLIYPNHAPVLINPSTVPASVSTGSNAFEWTATTNTSDFSA
ncbi:MAG: hypothetical protein PHQ23_15055, partial [Candidatus Wallbacteria bacterium]|nr:hypothetical protein [Candidatus Wallbacteria bacterium]